MRFWYNPAKLLIGDKGLDLVADDIRVLLVRTGSTAGSERDAQFIATLATLNEYDGANYVRKQVTGRAFVSEGAPDHRLRVTADDVVWANLGAASGGAQAIGAVYYLEAASDATRRLLLFTDEGGFPKNGTGSDPFTLEHVNDLVRLKDAA